MMDRRLMGAGTDSMGLSCDAELHVGLRWVFYIHIYAL